MALLLVAFFQVNAQTDQQMKSFIDKLMSQMTLEEKIGQLNLPVSSSFIAGEKKDGGLSPLEQRIAKGEIGGLFGMKGAKQIREKQLIAIEKSRLHIPLLFGLDVIHGYETTFLYLWPCQHRGIWNLLSVKPGQQLRKQVLTE